VRQSHSGDGVAAHILIVKKLDEEMRLTEEQRFFFDIKGYLVLPDVLDEDIVERLKAYINILETAPQSLPPADRGLPGGPAAELIDHPAVMGALEFAIHENRDKIRLEAAHCSIRTAGDTPPLGPHAGGRTVNPNYSYQYHDGCIFAGMTRVVFELNPVSHGAGGTYFKPGSHKANFPIPPAVKNIGHALFETYGCPAGSMVVFSEAVCHSSAPWLDESRPRIAIFYAYNHINLRHHKPAFNPDVIAGLSEPRRRLFHEVYHRLWDTRAERDPVGVHRASRQGAVR